MDFAKEICKEYKRSKKYKIKSIETTYNILLKGHKAPVSKRRHSEQVDLYNRQRPPNLHLKFRNNGFNKKTKI
jgi:hypothetical protein